MDFLFIGGENQRVPRDSTELLKGSGENQRVPRDSTELLKVSVTLNSVSNTTSHGWLSSTQTLVKSNQKNDNHQSVPPATVKICLYGIQDRIDMVKL